MRVAVIGGGVIGYAVAFELASRGARVRILDMRGPGAGATRASAGMLAPYIEGGHEPLLRLGILGLSLYDSFIDRAAGAARQRIEYRRTGTLQVPQSDSRREELAATAARLAAQQVAHEWRGGSLFIPDHGYVRVPQLMSVLEAAAGTLGIERSVARVERLEPAALDADAVVLAAGSWSGQVSGAPVRPIKGQTVELQSASPLPDHIIWGDDCYIVPWEDGALMVGATAEDAGFDEAIDEPASQRLVAAARRLLPGLAGAAVRESRVGLRPATPDELPVIGRSSTMPGVVYATGHYRNGILLAPLTAAMVAELVIPDEGGTNLSAEASAKAEVPQLQEALDLVRPERFNL
ncbi:MAG: FAD-dependent oxidoreductase [Vicinamibacterales bacterium]